ncbi:MAG: hypothetical protein ACI9MR_002912 [Myxococcota bacterium]|jgi:hypothetical protein
MRSNPASTEAREALAAEMRRPAEQIRRHPNDGWILADAYPLSPRLIAKFHGLIRAMCPAEPYVENLESRVEAQVRRMLPYMQPVIANGFKVALEVLDQAPRWLLKSPKRLQDLPRERASEVIAWLEDHDAGPLSDMVVAARAAVMAPFYDLEEVTDHIGYRPRPFMEGRVALRKRLLAGEEPQGDDMIGPFSPTTSEPTTEIGTA